MPTPHDPTSSIINPLDILNQLPNALAVVDSQGIVRYLNVAWEQLARETELYKAAWTVEQSVFAHVPSVDSADEAIHAQLAAGLRAVLTGQRDHFRSEYLLNSGGDTRWDEMTIVPHAVDGEAGALVQVADCTSHKSALATLLQERELLNALMESMPEQIYFKDTQGRFIRVNHVQSQILGLNAPHEAEGKTDFDFYLPEICQGAQDDEQRIIATGQPLIDKTESQTLADTDGIDQQDNIGWFSTTKAPIKDQHGSVIGIVGITRNITARKRAEEALRQSVIQEQIISAQAKILEELSTPLIPLTQNVVLMPLIGSIDSRRAQQVVETLLRGIDQYRAQVAIIDITGVRGVDTQVGNALIQAAHAARLLGARVMLTGIRPEVAQILVGLGIELTGIETRSSLQTGIAAVLR